MFLYHKYAIEIPEPEPVLSQHGAQIKGLQVFLIIKITGLRGAYVTCIYCGLRVKINTRKTLHGAQRSWMHFFFHVWSAKPKDP